LKNTHAGDRRCGDLR